MKRWYLVYCKRGDQKRAQQHLENQGVECFYPQIEVEKSVRGKEKRVEEPLFPSYIFVRFDYEQGPSFTTVRSTRGVVDFIKFGARPHEVQGDLVFELKEFDKCCSNEVAHLGFVLFHVQLAWLMSYQLIVPQWQVDHQVAVGNT